MGRDPPWPLQASTVILFNDLDCSAFDLYIRELPTNQLCKFCRRSMLVIVWQCDHDTFWAFADAPSRLNPKFHGLTGNVPLHLGNLGI